MKDGLDILPYREGDEQQILELFRLSYGGRQLPLSYWRWRFCDNPSGCGLISLAWHHNVLAAHYAVTSMSMSIEGCDCYSGLSGTTMTHPAYRGQRLFSKIASRTYQEMSDRGMVMVWGFPNAMSHRGFISNLGWQDIYEIPTLRLHLSSQENVSAVYPSRVSELFYVDEQFDQLWEERRTDYDIIIRRDRSYMNWRYFLNPMEKYRLIVHVENEQIQGYAIFKRYEDEIQIVDLLIGKEGLEVGKSLMDYIIAQAATTAAGSISLWLNVTHPFHHVLERMGFRPEGPVTYLCGLILNSKFANTLDNFSRWYFSMSDSDVY